MNSVLRLFGAATFVFILASCGPGRPDASDGAAYLESHVGDGSRLSITSFDKTDGVSAEEGGVAHYTMMFTAEATFSSNAMYSVGMPLLSQGSHIEVAEYRPPSTGFSWNEFLASSQGWRTAGEGDRLSLSGEMAFERRESGWTPIALQFSFVHDSTTRSPDAKLTTPAELYASLKSDLKNLASNQEIYYADYHSYTSDKVALRFTPSPGVSVAVTGGERGWSAVAFHEDLPEGEGCALIYGFRDFVASADVPVAISLPRRPSSGELLCTR